MQRKKNGLVSRRKRSGEITRSGQPPEAAPLNESQGRSSIRENTGSSLRPYITHCPGTFVEPREQVELEQRNRYANNIPRFIPAPLRRARRNTPSFPVLPSPRLIPILTRDRLTTVMGQLTEQKRVARLLTPRALPSNRASLANRSSAPRYREFNGERPCFILSPPRWFILRQ